MKNSRNEYFIDLVIASVFYFLNEYVHRSVLYNSGLAITIPIIVIRSAVFIAIAFFLKKIFTKPEAKQVLNNFDSLAQNAIKNLDQIVKSPKGQNKTLEYKKLLAFSMIIILFIAVGNWFMKDFLFNLGLLIVSFRIYNRNVMED